MHVLGFLALFTVFQQQPDATVSFVRSADGVTIAYESRGSSEPDIPSLVFIHGGLADRSVWQHQQVLSTSYRVVTLDLGGHGASGNNRSAWTLSSLSGDVEAVVEHLRLEQVVLVGSSLGGAVALEMAHKIPERVAAVVAVDSLHAAANKPDPEAWKSYVEGFRRDYKEACRALASSLFHPEADPGLVEAVLQKMSASRPEVTLSLLESFTGYDASEALAGVRAPVRSINGDLFPTDIPGNRRFHPDYDAVVLSGVGHFPMMERPEEFNRHLVTLIQEIGAEGRAKAKLSHFEGKIEETLRKTTTPGAAVAVLRGSGVIWSRGVGVGNVETGGAVTRDTLFQIGSLTKLLTATAVLIAVEEGRLSLDEPVGRYVSGLAPCLSRVTLGELLSHTAGLKDEPDEYGPHDEEALARYIRSWGEDSCLLPPGRAFSYSNSGFALAGLALEEALGKRYADVMNELLFAPLGMKSTTFRPTVAMTYPHAVGHRVQDGSASVVRPMGDDARLWPAGEIYTNVADLSRFALAFMNQGSLDGRQLIPRTVIEALGSVRAEVPAIAGHYGFGLFIDKYRDRRQFGHGGTMPGFGALFRILPAERIGVLVLANRDGAILDGVADLAFDTLLFESPAADAPPDALPPEVPMTEVEMERSVGSFSNPQRWTLKIRRQGPGLVLEQFGGEFPLVKLADGRTLLKTPGGRTQRVVLGLGGDGRVEFVQFAVWAFVRTPNGKE